MTEYIYKTQGEQVIGNPKGFILPKEKIIRCRDCKYWATEARFTGMCVGKQFNPDGFCAWSEPKEDSDD